ncbi:unnamed protein product [Rotaria magnacalcarata]|uniref:Uncharacterized protein n=1 Tax=Rotaria magnacalcarata TaxID=392030 RepID=A0A814Z8K8_9BILA|nr:unnamed protein product [Rotaria magnacalcarata]CAF1598033.1 unnamed protein product [Rotaria magnacalcarata]CAF3884144.1 unnamed protein product [Rotaria magnacalcarata]
MATPTFNRAFQAYNNHSFKNHPAVKKTPISTMGEPSAFDHIPYSSIKTSTEKVPSLPPSPDSTSSVKRTSVLPAKRASIVSMANLLPRRKSLQMTALATQRQSLWINLAKNAQINNSQVSSFPLRQQQTNLLRKKLLRLLLVFSYLLSISLFAIALATFYGFFWTGYSKIPPTTSSALTVGTTISSTDSLKSNSTLIDINVSPEDAS